MTHFRTRLEGDDVTPQALRRLVSAYEDGVAASELAGRFGRRAQWVRDTVRAVLASSSSAMVLV